MVARRDDTDRKIQSLDLLAEERLHIGEAIERASRAAIRAFVEEREGAQATFPEEMKELVCDIRKRLDKQIDEWAVARVNAWYPEQGGESPLPPREEWEHIRAVARRRTIRRRREDDAREDAQEEAEAAESEREELAQSPHGAGFGCLTLIRGGGRG